MQVAKEKNIKPNYFVIGLAPDGGRMLPEVKQVCTGSNKSKLEY